MAMKLSPRDTMIAIGVVAALALVLFLVFAIRPKVAELTQAKADQKIEADKLAQNKMKLARLDAIRREAADIEAQRIELARRMPKEAELPSFIIDLQRTANDADLDLSNLTLSEPEGALGFQEIPFKLNASGSFYTLIDFLYRLEEMKRDVIVDDLNISVGSYPLLSIAISGRTFMVVEKEAPAAQESTSANGVTPAAAAGGNPGQPAP